MEKITSEQFRNILDESGFENYNYVDILNLLCNYCYERAKYYKQKEHSATAKEWSARADKLYNILDAIFNFYYL